jgi:hypothetical protein
MTVEFKRKTVSRVRISKKSNECTEVHTTTRRAKLLKQELEAIFEGVVQE